MLSDAGDTLFARARNVESELGFGRIWIKFEGSNPSGTQKDRIAQAAHHEATEQGFAFMTVATCGNYGAAVARACRGDGVQAVIYVPTEYHTPRVLEMERLGARVVRVPGSYEDAVAASSAAAAEHGWYDSNPGSTGQWELSRHAYGSIAREIVNQLGRIPDTVSCPVGNGTTLAAVFDGFKEVIRERREALPGDPARRDGAPREGHDADEFPLKLPRMIAASTPRGNPVIKSFLAGVETCNDLEPADLKETAVNEPLVNWHAFDGDRALAALRESNGTAVYASDRDMQRAAGLLRREEGISVMTASTAALVGLAKAVHQDPDGWGDTHVAVLTGRAYVRPPARPIMPTPVAAPVTATAPEEAGLTGQYFVPASVFAPAAKTRPRM